MAILTFLHHHDATDDLAPSVVRQGSITNSRTIAHTCYITNKHRTSRSIRDSNLSDIFKRASHTHTSNKEGIRLLINIRSSCILIARLQSRIDIRQGQAYRAQSIRVNRNFILFQFTAKAIDFRNAFSSIQTTSDNPILQRAQLHSTILALFLR